MHLYTISSVLKEKKNKEKEGEQPKNFTPIILSL